MDSEVSTLLKGKTDVYQGLTVSSSEHSLSAEELAPLLETSLAEWRKTGVRACWIRIRLAEAHWIPVCAKSGFVFHHARGDETTMIQWLQDTPDQSPRYPFTAVGVGGVIRDKDGRVLLMKERRGVYLGWKFPGGLLDPNEELWQGCEREVEEETGVAVKITGVLAWRHTLKTKYKDCADLYFLLLGRPTGSLEPKPCLLESADARWFTKEELESEDASKNIVPMILWALAEAEKCAKAGFPDGVTQQSHDILQRYGRPWNVWHLPEPRL